MPEINLRLLVDAVTTRLAGVTNATGYLGTVGRGLDGTLGPGPAPKSDDDPRVRPYFVVFPGFGGPTDEPDLATTAVDQVVPFPVTVAGGDAIDVLDIARRVHTRLHRWAPGLLGVGPAAFIGGPLEVPPGYRAPLLTDRAITPHRLYVPLQYQLTAHT